MTFRQSTIPILFGSPRPGYPSTKPPPEAVAAWIAEAKKMGVVRVCCLLDDAQLAYYSPDLVETYRRAFGAENVLHSPIQDCTSCPPNQVEKQILPYVMDAIRAGEPIVVHCSAGIGRTGQVLEAATNAAQSWDEPGTRQKESRRFRRQHPETRQMNFEFAMGERDAELLPSPANLEHLHSSPQSCVSIEGFFSTDMTAGSTGVESPVHAIRCVECGPGLPGLLRREDRDLRRTFGWLTEQLRHPRLDEQSVRQWVGARLEFAVAADADAALGFIAIASAGRLSPDQLNVLIFHGLRTIPRWRPDLARRVELFRPLIEEAAGSENAKLAESARWAIAALDEASRNR